MKNLDLFKLNKRQMNMVHGGKNGKKKYKCHLSAVEYGGGTKDIIVKAKSALEAEDIAQKEGDIYYVFCQEA